MGSSVSVVGRLVGLQSHFRVGRFALLLFVLLFVSIFCFSSSYFSHQNVAFPYLCLNCYDLQPKSPSSFEYVYAEFNVTLYDNDTAHFSCFFSANNTGTENLNDIDISFSVTQILNLQVENKTHSLYNVVAETLTTKTIIHMNVSDLLPNNVYNFTVSFDTSQVISVTSSFNQFLYFLRADVNMKLIIFQVKLPPERFLYTSGVDPLIPPATLNFTDGSSLIFEWIMGLNEGEYETLVIRYELLNSTTSTLTSYFPLFYKDTSSLNSILFLLIFLAGLGVVGVFAFYLYHKNRLVETVSDTSLTLLSEAEIKILKAIASSENKRVNQKEIQKATNYSKAKVSITLAILEKKGFIKREPRGRTNIVTLLKDIRF
ncbi:MAG: MarR family transcriptional regulator [Candidatus Jordarchaeaceae archaeon]